MKKTRLLFMFFVALLVTQISNAQVVHSTYDMDIETEFCPDFGEPIVGEIHYLIITHYDKSDNPRKSFFNAKTGWLVGESGAEYKVVDVGTSVPSYTWPFPGPEDNVEFTLINNLKIISKGTGKVYYGRVQIKFFFDKVGNLIVKKNINTTCF